MELAHRRNRQRQAYLIPLSKSTIISGCQMRIVYNPVSLKSVALLSRIAERFEYHGGMLPQHWSRAIELGRRTGILYGKANCVDATRDRMLDLDIHSACLYLWMLVDLVKCQNRTTGNASLF